VSGSNRPKNHFWFVLLVRFWLTLVSHVNLDHLGGGVCLCVTCPKARSGGVAFEPPKPLVDLATPGQHVGRTCQWKVQK
jgi:hypothetical protein